MKKWVQFFIFFSLISLPSYAAQPVGTGLLKEDAQAYAAFRSVPKFRDYLPKEVDLSAFFPIARSQGSQGSCTAWATGYGMRSYYYHRVAAAGDASKVIETSFSPAYIYNQIKKGQDCSEATRISDALRLLKNEGVAKTSLFPYDRGSCSSLPNKQVKQEASAFKIDGWKRVNEKRMDDLKGSLADGHPIAIGFFIGPDFYDVGKNDIYDQVVDNTKASGHAMVLVGYSEEKQAFRVFNSWGTDWADQGLAWISYKAVKANLDSAFIMDIDIPELVIKEPKPRVSAQKKKQTAVVQKIKNEPKKVVPKVNIAPPAVPDITQVLRRKISNFKCFALSRETSKGQLSGIQGYVGSETDLLILKNVLNVHPKGKQVSLHVNVRAWPQCEALQTFSKMLGARQKMAVETLSDKGELRKSYEKGEKLVVRVKTPDFPSYLYVTYLQSGGDAVHLVRGADNKGKPFAPNTSVIFGNSADQPTFRVDAPFGKEMIMVMATRKPLFDETYDIVEEERSYLTRFRKGILTKLGRKVMGNVAATSVILTTLPKH